MKAVLERFLLAVAAPVFPQAWQDLRDGEQTRADP